MAVQLTIPYETLVELVEQLPPEEQRNLLHRLQERMRQQALSDEEWQAAFRSLMIHAQVSDDFPIRRADWYDDDGR